MPKSEFDQSLVREQRLEAVNCLATGVAHEFNNVLQIVRGYVSFSRDASPVGSEVRADLDNALLATDRAADLSRRMLQFARAEDDSAGMADVTDAVESVALLLKPIVGENIQVEVDAESDPPLVGVGEASLRQAILNLCINARDAMPDGGTLRLSTRLVGGAAVTETHIGGVTDGPYVELSVADTGMGMDPSTIEHAFEPFFTTKDPGEGTGLGLAMIAGFVSGSGGAIRVSSVEGGGTTINLYLPVVTEEAVPLLQNPPLADGGPADRMPFLQGVEPPLGEAIPG